MRSLLDTFQDTCKKPVRSPSRSLLDPLYSPSRSLRDTFSSNDRRSPSHRKGYMRNFPTSLPYAPRTPGPRYGDPFWPRVIRDGGRIPPLAIAEAWLRRTRVPPVPPVLVLVVVSTVARTLINYRSPSDTGVHKTYRVPAA